MAMNLPFAQKISFSDPSSPFWLAVFASCFVLFPQTVEGAFRSTHFSAKERISASTLEETDIAESRVDAFAPPGTPQHYSPEPIADFLHASIEIVPDLIAQTISGNVQYRFRLHPSSQKSAHKELLLHAASDLQIDGAWLNGQAVPHRQVGEQLFIGLNSLASASDSVHELKIVWHGKPEIGLYFQGPETFEERQVALNRPIEANPSARTRSKKPTLPLAQRKLQAWTQGEMHETRHWLPVWDFPNDRLTSEFKIYVPEGFTVIANGQHLQTSDGLHKLGNKKLKLWHFKQEQNHVSYLLSFIVGRFASHKEQAEGTPLEYYVASEDSDKLKPTFRRTPEILSFFNRKIGFTYPYAKYAQSAVQEFTFGGMENISASTLTDKAIHSEALDPFENKEDLIAHEMAHQWWGDLITTRDWSHIWLNEGFATYFTSLWIEEGQGKDEFDFRRLREAQSYFAEAKRYERPLVTRSYVNPFTLFDRHTYPKGGWILHMLRRELGDSLFWQVIQHYAKHNAYQVVDTSDFKRSLRQVSGRSFDHYFDQWVFGPGHPKLQGKWHWEAESKQLVFEVRQKQKDSFRFLLKLEIATRTKDGPGFISHRIEINKQNEQIRFPCESAPLFVVVDPGRHLLAKLDIQQDEKQWLHQLQYASRSIDRALAAIAIRDNQFDSDEIVAALDQIIQSDAHHQLRQHAAQALAGLDSTPAQKARLQAARNSYLDPRVRVHLLRSLQSLSFDAADQPNDQQLKTETLEFLLMLAKDDANTLDPLRSAAVSSLANYIPLVSSQESDISFKQRRQQRRTQKKQEKLLNELRQLIRHPGNLHSHNYQVEIAVVGLLARAGTQEDFELLVQLLAPIRPTALRLASARALTTMLGRQELIGEAEKAEVENQLLELLRDRNLIVRTTAIPLAQKVSPRKSRKIIRRLASHDPSSRVRSAAEKALRP